MWRSNRNARAVLDQVQNTAYVEPRPTHQNATIEYRLKRRMRKINDGDVFLEANGKTLDIWDHIR